MNFKIFTLLLLSSTILGTLFNSLAYSDTATAPTHPYHLMGKEKPSPATADEPFPYTHCEISGSDGFRPQWWTWSVVYGEDVLVQQQDAKTTLILKCWNPSNTDYNLPLYVPIQITSNRLGLSAMIGANGSTGVLYRFGNLKGKRITDIFGRYSGIHYGINAIFGFNAYYFRKDGISLQVLPYMVDIGVGFSLAKAQMDISLDEEAFSKIPTDLQEHYNRVMRLEIRKNPKFQLPWG
jgi:hypothetical protein